MDVVFHATDFQRWAIEVVADPNQIRMDPFTERVVLEEWLAILRRKDQMHVDLRE